MCSNLNLDHCKYYPLSFLWHFPSLATVFSRFISCVYYYLFLVFFPSSIYNALLTNVNISPTLPNRPSSLDIRIALDGIRDYTNKDELKSETLLLCSPIGIKVEDEYATLYDSDKVITFPPLRKKAYTNTHNLIDAIIASYEECCKLVK